MPWAELAAAVETLRKMTEDGRRKVLCVCCGSDLGIPRDVPLPPIVRHGGA
jgi:hypothetical protein